MNYVRLTAMALVAILTGFWAISPAVAQKTSTKPAIEKAKKKSSTKKTTKKTPATKSTARKSTAKKTKAASKKAPSKCVGLSQNQCKANKQCGWVNYKKKVASNGRKLTDHCRKVAGIAKKKN